MMNTFTLLTEGATEIPGGLGLMGTLGYILVFVAIFYFFAIRPQKKQQKKQDELMSSIAVGDSILTTSGFYGVIIDMVDDDVIIVEFGNNKNCRIPMKKAAIVEVEKPNKEN